MISKSNCNNKVYSTVALIEIQLVLLILYTGNINAMMPPSCQLVLAFLICDPESIFRTLDGVPMLKRQNVF